jgi:hypothetical protein
MALGRLQVLTTVAKMIPAKDPKQQLVQDKSKPTVLF